MCGIVGYIGHRQAYPLLHAGLQCLEYRGYDSAGIAVQDSGTVHIAKTIGRVHSMQGPALPGTIGIGHTRWATHGIPSKENAHPHSDCTRKIAVVHNGIIENYRTLRDQLIADGHKFSSDTDTEVIAHLFESQYRHHQGKDRMLQSLLACLKALEGVWGIAVLHADHDELIVSRNGAPLLLGLGTNEQFVASDASPIIPHTRNIIYLDDLEIARLTREHIEVFDRQGRKKDKNIHEIKWSVEQAQKGGHAHFMLKEIHDQPLVAKQSLRIPIEANLKAHRFFLVACGTAWHAALIGKYLIEQLAGIPVTVEVASEFRYQNPIIGTGDLFIAISQSGETADTLAALRLAKQKGARTLGIINVLNSTIAREADDVIYTRAGMEVGVASTKAFLSQLIVLYQIAEKLSGKEIPGFDQLPELLDKFLQGDVVQAIAEKYSRAHGFLFIGRNIQYPVALEGALKLKEISYLHAEGYPAGELKHGPIALVTQEVPTVAICVRDPLYPKMISNIQEVRARNGAVLAIATEGDQEILHHANEVIFVPATDPLLAPFFTTVAVQLLAYHIANARECDIDKPRNLAKSVTVE